MKRLFNILMLFFALALSLMLSTNELSAQAIKTIDYIQNTKSETLVLVSNNLLGGEIYSNQEETSNFIGNCHFLNSSTSKRTSFNKNQTHINGSFIHNLSTDKTKIHQIRAP